MRVCGFAGLRVCGFGRFDSCPVSEDPAEVGGGGLVVCDGESVGVDGWEADACVGDRCGVSGEILVCLEVLAEVVERFEPRGRCMM